MAHTNDELRLLRISDVMEIFPVSRMTIYRMVKQNRFPKPVRFGGSSAWPYREVRDYVDGLKAERNDDDLI